MFVRRSVIAAMLLTAVLCGSAIAADVDLKAAARDALGLYAESVVPLKVVSSTKVTYQGRDMPAQERESEVLGTVLDDSGLMVTSLTMADPGSSDLADRPGLKIESEIKSAKLIQKDGKQLALKIVLRDKDLDLMFVRPETPTKLPNLGLKKKGAEPGVADDLLVVSRLGAVGDRQPSLAICRITAVIDKPRRVYVIDVSASIMSLGCPAFTAKGELVGIVVVRTAKGGDGGGLLGGIGSQILPVVLPVANILDDMGQIEKPEK